MVELFDFYLNSLNFSSQNFLQNLRIFQKVFETPRDSGLRHYYYVERN